MTRRQVRSCLIAVMLGLPLTGVSLAQVDEGTDAAARLAAELPRVPPHETAAAAETFRLLDGFRLQLLAAEPLVTDPVAIKYDENGLAYVAEMGDYPYSDKSHDRPHADQTSLPLGRVRVLEDVDGDGQFDKSTILADKLSWPTGLALWKGGVFVTSTPDIIYLKDTDGDRRADIHRTVYSGFRKFNVQSVINNLQWGLDHRIYGSGSLNGGEIRRTADADAAPVTMGRSDFRFDPASEAFELVAGGARFGNTFDDWGNRFLCDIRNPVQHIVLENRYLARNPSLSIRSALHDAGPSGPEVPVFRASPPEPWRIINSQRLASDPDSTSPTSEKVAAGFLTSSSGITVYRGAAYPPDYYGNVFVGDVAGNLTMRYTLRPQGTTFEAARVHGEHEFLASTDNWFRPVNYANAPDGTLHLLDMYRETIEHPWSIPDDIKSHLDLVSGRDRGRIYRLVPAAYRAGFEEPPRPQLGKATTAELVAQLENVNGWWRETAHRLLYERQDSTAVPDLRRLLRQGGTAVARLHALWSLAGLGQLADEDLLGGLSDESPHVRRHSVRLAEPRLSGSPPLVETIINRAADPDVRVRFQVAFTLGEIACERATTALVQIAQRDGGDRWMRAAVLSSLADSAAPFLVRVIRDERFASQPAVLEQLALTVGDAGSADEILRVLASLPQAETLSESSRQLQRSVVAGLGSGLQRSGRSLPSVAGKTAAGKMIARLLSDAEQAVAGEGRAVDERLAAMEMIGFAEFDQARRALSPLLDARQPTAIQSAAIATLSEFRTAEVADALLERYERLTPSLRKQVVQSLLARSDRLPKLVAAVAEQRVSPTLVSSSQRRRILSSSDEALAGRAGKLFDDHAPSPRGPVVERYQAALALVPARSNGEVVFRRECLTCHQLGDEGHEVGPNLTTVRHRTAADVMLHILDPNREVSPNYLDYTVVTNGGRVFAGAIAAETATGITIRTAEGKEQIVLRRDIDTITSSGKSMMPEGLEQKITPQEMADLLAFVLNQR